VMLQINREFIESKTPRRFRDRALVKPSQGEVWSLNPVANRNPNSLPESSVRSTPMWQAQLRG